MAAGKKLGARPDSRRRNAVPQHRHARHPSPRLRGLLLAVALALALTGGAVLVPRLRSGPAAVPAGTASTPGRAVVPTASLGPAPTPTPSPAGAGRPADALAGWAGPLAARLDIPEVALQAYGYAELVIAAAQPSCQLHWSTLAGIARIESDHGRAHAPLRPDGRTEPPIIGPALDGRDGRLRVADTDGGLLDHDRTLDHAVGPMQFLPSTWHDWAIDADGDGVADPHDLDDAALAAGNYLCSGGRTLSTADGWWAALLAYNGIQAYARDVFNAADDYGRRSHD